MRPGRPCCCSLGRRTRGAPMSPSSISYRRRYAPSPCLNAGMAATKWRLVRAASCCLHRNHRSGMRRRANAPYRLAPTRSLGCAGVRECPQNACRRGGSSLEPVRFGVPRLVMTPERPIVSGVAVVLIQVERERREELRKRLIRYLVEYRTIINASVEATEGGVPAYPWFDYYWSEPDRIPFLVEQDGNEVGFVLVRVMDAGWNIAEFGIDSACRRRGVGRAAVEALAMIARRAGAEHLRADIHPANSAARDFWRSCGFETVTAGVDQFSTQRRLTRTS